MFAQNYLLHLVHEVRMLGSHVVVLMDVFCQVVEVGNPLLYHHLPVAHAETNLVGFVELPVEEVVCLLCLVVA